MRFLLAVDLLSPGPLKSFDRNSLVQKLQFFFFALSTLACDFNRRPSDDRVLFEIINGMSLRHDVIYFTTANAVSSYCGPLFLRTVIPQRCYFNDLRVLLFSAFLGSLVNEFAHVVFEKMN